MCRHDNFRYPRLGRQWCHRQRGGSDAKARNNIHLVVSNQLLRDALGIFRICTVILQDNFNLFVGDGVAMLLHVKLDRVVELLAGRGLPASHWDNQPDLDRTICRQSRGNMRHRGCCHQRDDRNGRQQALVFHPHETLLPNLPLTLSHGGYDDGRQKQILALLMIGAHFPLSALMKVKPSTLRPGGEGEMAPNRPQTLIRLDVSVGSN